MPLIRQAARGTLPTPLSRFPPLPAGLHAQRLPAASQLPTTYLMSPCAPASAALRLLLTEAAAAAPPPAEALQAAPGGPGSTHSTTTRTLTSANGPSTHHGTQPCGCDFPHEVLEGPIPAALLDAALAAAAAAGPNLPAMERLTAHMAACRGPVPNG